MTIVTVSPGAVDDFSAAIAIEPRFPDCWKRRGQAHGGMGALDPALADFKQCIALSRDPKVRAECYLERGTIYQKQRDYRQAEAELHVRGWRKHEFKASPRSVIRSYYSQTCILRAACLSDTS